MDIIRMDHSYCKLLPEDLENSDQIVLSKYQSLSTSRKRKRQEDQSLYHRMIETIPGSSPGDLRHCPEEAIIQDQGFRADNLLSVKSASTVLSGNGEVVPNRKPTHFRLSPSFCYEDIKGDIEDDDGLSIDLDCSSSEDPLPAEATDEPLDLRIPQRRTSSASDLPQTTPILSVSASPEPEHINTASVPYSPMLNNPASPAPEPSQTNPWPCLTSPPASPVQHPWPQVTVYSPASKSYFLQPVLHPYLAEWFGMPRFPTPLPRSTVALHPWFQVYGPFAPRSMGPLVTITPGSPTQYTSSCLIHSP